jgi:hypothetical protein
MSNVPKSANDLREMVYHTDARVTAMEGKINYVADGQDKLAMEVRSFISTQTQPRNTNYAAWVGVFLSGVVMLIGGTLGLTRVFTLAQEPLLQDVATNSKYVDALKVWQNQTHYEFGVQHENNATQTSEIDRLWEHIHKQEEADAKHSSDLAEFKATLSERQKRLQGLLRERDKYRELEKSYSARSTPR